MLVANKPKTDLSDVVKEICKERLDWQAGERQRSHSGGDVENEEQILKEMERERKTLER